MVDITIIEAKEYAKQMSNFFRAFRFVDETLDHAVAVEELIKSHDLRLEKILEEVEGLKEKKQDLMNDITRLGERVEEEKRTGEEKIAESRSACDEEIKKFLIEQQRMKDELIAFSNDCNAKKQMASINLNSSLREMQEEFKIKEEELKSLQEEAEIKLSETEAKLDLIRKLIG